MIRLPAGFDRHAAAAMAVLSGCMDSFIDGVFISLILFSSVVFGAAALKKPAYAKAKTIDRPK